MQNKIHFIFTVNSLFHILFFVSPGYCLEYATILDKEAKPYKVDPFVIMIKFLLG
jgi:hypothetical protein